MDIWLLNNKFEPIIIIDEYESLIWTDRYNQMGDFEIYTTINSSWVKFIKKDYYLINNESDRTMIIEDILIESDVENGDKITIKGRSVEQILERRIIWGTKTFTTELGNDNLQNGIKTLLEENVINPIVDTERRRINNFIFVESTDPRITSLTFEGQYTGDNLYETIQKLCDEKQLGFKVILNNDTFFFSLYFGIDRSYNQTDNQYIIFSPNFDNLLNSNYHETDIEYRNVALVAGTTDDEGYRDYLGVGLDVSGLDRRETFINASDISYKTEDDVELTTEEYKQLLMQRGNEELSKIKKTQLFEGTIDGTSMFKYNRDFFMGDILQVENIYGYSGFSRMTEIITTHDKEGYKQYPTFTNLNDEGEPIK